jgi:hypothetical protein
MSAIIGAKGLTKRFGQVPALDGLDLVAESGHVTALLGDAEPSLVRRDPGGIRRDRRIPLRSPALADRPHTNDREHTMTTDFDLDMTMMYAVHDALRRDLQLVAPMTARSEGWDFFARLLHAHHVAEDDALWPVLRETLAGRTEDLALLDEMAAEHDALGPLLEVIDDALDRGESAPGARADLAARLQEHLVHEEEAALPLIDRTLDEEQWMEFGEAAAARIGLDMPHFLPWVLDGADAERTTEILGSLPEPVQQTYRDEWQPAYAAKEWWAP